MPTIDISSLAVRILGTVLVASLMIAALLYFVTIPQRARKAATVAHATAVTSDASKQAAQDALKITVDTQAVHGRIDVVTQGNANAIRNAPGASSVVDTGVHSAGLRSLCLRDAYKDDQTCRIYDESN